MSIGTQGPYILSYSWILIDIDEYVVHGFIVYFVSALL